MLGDHRKIRAASMVYPDSPPVGTPAVASGARRIAELPHDTHTAALGIQRAGVPSHVVGAARNRLLAPASPVLVIAIVVAEIAVPAGAEIRAASMIHPYTLVVRAPAISFGASGAAVLFQQPHSASRIHRAGVPSLILGAAGNRLRLRISGAVLIVAIGVAVLIVPVIPVSADCEVRAASVVHPHALIVGAPAVSFGARRVAVLRRQTHTAPSIRRAGMPSLIV